ASYYAGSPHRCRPHRNGQHHHLCTAQLVRSDEVNPDPVSAPVARLGAMTSTSTNTAHAIIQTDPKDPSSLEWQAIDKPQPAEGEALVRIHYAGLNRADTLQARGHYPPPKGVTETIGLEGGRDRKSTRLNSSHVSISYAVFCLKKKKKTRHSDEGVE